MLIRRCDAAEFDAMLDVVNDAAVAYRGIIAADQWREPYIGTWSAATWAVRFYERHGFRLVSGAAKDELLRRYWNIPERQIDESVVLADERFLGARGASR